MGPQRRPQGTLAWDKETLAWDKEVVEAWLKGAAPSLILNRASTNRPSGEWNDDDFDVLADGRRGRPHHEGARRAGRDAVVMDTRPVMAN